MWLIVGLGNPGEEYASTRHNIGFMTISALARRERLEFSGKRANARIAEGTIGGEKVCLARPQTFMNLSGQAVVGLAQWFKLDVKQRLVVVYDDFDLPFGVLRLRDRGSAGTHNGMKSIIGQLGHQEFIRLRMGIGPKPPEWETTKFVLGRFSRDEQERLPPFIDRAADALTLLVRDGLVTAMNRVNSPAESST